MLWQISPDLFRVSEELTLREWLIFYQGTKFVPEKGERKEVLEIGNRFRLDRTRTKKKNPEFNMFLKDCMEYEMSDRTHKTWSIPLVPVPLL